MSPQNIEWNTLQKNVHTSAKIPEMLTVAAILETHDHALTS